MEILSLRKNQRIVTNLEVADSFFRRFKGLMGRKELPDGFGLLIKPCNSVHTCFMRIPIDVLFINRDFQIIKIIEEMKPFQFGPIVRGATMVIEIPGGTVTRLDLMVGDKLKIQSQVF